MRIDLNNSIAQEVAAERTAQNNTKPDSASASMGEDKATFSKASMTLPALIQSAMKPPSTRQERVAALREVVSSGKYKVDTEAVADAMLNEAGF
jgi:flagellar biosynthesis anti-sigma factor FlgM